MLCYEHAASAVVGVLGKIVTVGLESDNTKEDHAGRSVAGIVDNVANLCVCITFYREFNTREQLTQLHK